MSSEQPADINIFSKPPSSEGASVLMGFPGSGLVGSIALQYLVDQMEFSLIGVVTSKYFPPLAMMNKGVINVPVRIYEKTIESQLIVTIVADIPIHPMICYEVANGLMNWLTPFKVREVVAIAGIVTNEPEKRVFGVSTSDDALARIQDHTLVLPVGSISGIASSILTECKIRGVNAYGLLGETINAPDPRASASALEVLSKMYNITIDTAPLIEQAEEIESTMQKLSEQVQSAETMPKKEDLSMYV
jgi:uncharacterized protein